MTATQTAAIHSRSLIHRTTGVKLRVWWCESMSKAVVDLDVKNETMPGPHTANIAIAEAFGTFTPKCSSVLEFETIVSKARAMK